MKSMDKKNICSFTTNDFTTQSCKTTNRKQVEWYWKKQQPHTHTGKKVFFFMQKKYFELSTAFPEFFSNI